MNYVVEARYSRDDFSGFARAAFCSRGVKNSKLMSVISAIFFLILSIVSILIFYAAKVDMPLLYLVIPAIMLCCSIFKIANINSSITGSFVWKKYEFKDSKIIFSFNDDSFVELSPRKENKLKYDAVKMLLEDNERFYIFIAPNVGYILPKKDFTRGDYGSFSQFISSKTGTAVVKI